MTNQQAIDLVEDLQEHAVRMAGVGCLMEAVVEIGGHGNGSSTGIFELLAWAIDKSNQESDRKYRELLRLLGAEVDDGEPLLKAVA